MTCKCVPCGDCGGTGKVWFTFDGKYLGNHRTDDMDELELCPDCDGSGIVEICDDCAEASEREFDEQFAAPTIPNDSGAGR